MMQYYCRGRYERGRVKSSFQVAVGVKVKSGERCRKGCHVLEVLGLKQHGGSFESLQMRINSLFFVVESPVKIKFSVPARKHRRNLSTKMLLSESKRVAK